MPQQQQSNMVKPQKVGGAKMGMTRKMKPSDFPGMDSKVYNNPAYNKIHGDKPKKTSMPKKTSKTPSYAKVQKSVMKSMGY